MKKLLLAVILLIVPYCLFAQFSVGFKITPFFCNANRAFGSTGNDVTVQTGHFGVWNFGGFINYGFKEYFALQTEANYRVEGLIYTHPVEGAFVQEIVEVPLLFQIKGKNKNYGFVELGLSLKCLISATHYLPNDEYNADSYFNLFRLSGKIGAGGVVNIWRNFSITGNLRLGYDITPIGKPIYEKRTNQNWAFDKIRYFDLNIFLGIMYTFR